MKVVVTGATGHIGNVLVRKLIEKGYKVATSTAFYLDIPENDITGNQYYSKEDVV